MSPSSSDAEPTVRGFAAGQRVFARYTLRSILGRGGMGVVWRAHDETLDEDVALKFLPDAVRWDPAAFDDLKAETRRARQLTHPNIVRIHDFVEDAGGAAISMEVVEGQTLTQLRLGREDKILEVADIARWLPQLCAALDYAHTQARVVHRDLKPSNLMLTAEGVLKVADFGVARSLTDSVTRVSMMSAGTMVYMSPQQAMGEEPSPADDIYALGATLYELLTGKPPFHTGDVRMQLFQRKPDGIALRRRALGVDGNGVSATGEVPVAWEKTILTCLAKEAAVRPATAGEVAAKLGRKMTALKSPPAGRTVSWAAWRRCAVAVVGLGGVMLAWGLWPAALPEVAPWPKVSRRAPVTRLVSRLTFDDEVKDEGGHMGNLANGSLVPTLDRHGRADRAMLFNGNEGVAVDAGPELRWSLRTPFSVAVWVRTDAAPRTGASILVSDPSEVGAALWSLSLDGQNQPAFGLDVLHVENVRRRIWSAPRPLTIGRWHHVAAVSDGVEMRLLVDGELAAREPIADPETRVPAKAKIQIGGGRLADRHWFVGALDEVRIYRGALTAVEVRALAHDAPARYRRSKGIYGEGDDLTAALKVEFGPEARLADWLELKAVMGVQVDRLADELELITGDNSFFVTRAGRRTFDDRRYYHVIRFGGTKPDYFLAHDELGGNVLALGSWYGHHVGALARVALPAPRVERMEPGGELPHAWSVSAGAAWEARRLVARGAAVAVARERRIEGDTMSCTWRGGLESGGKAVRHGVEWTTTAGEEWTAVCETVGGGRDAIRVTLGRRGRPERTVEMRPAFGELVFTLVARPGQLRWRVTTASSGTLVVDERLEVPGFSPAETAKVRWLAESESGVNPWLSDLEWREEWSK